MDGIAAERIADLVGFSGLATNPLNGFHRTVGGLDAIATTESTTIAGSLFNDNGNGFDNDPDNDALTVIAVNGSAANVDSFITLPSGSRLFITSDGIFQYTPDSSFDVLNSGESTTESFTYTISDGTAADTATVTVTINGFSPHQPPTAFDDAIATDEATPITTSLFLNNGSGADRDPDGDALTITAINGVAANVGQQITLASGATLQVNSNGVLSFVPNVNTMSQ